MKDIPIPYKEMDDYKIGEPTDNELLPEINRVVNKFDLRFAELVVSYDQDITTEGIDNKTTAGEQLALCVNMIQALGVGLAVLEGLCNQANSMALGISQKTTAEARVIDAKNMCSKLLVRKSYFLAAIKTLEWRIPMLRDYVKSSQYG